MHRNGFLTSRRKTCQPPTTKTAKSAPVEIFHNFVGGTSEYKSSKFIIQSIIHVKLFFVNTPQANFN